MPDAFAHTFRDHGHVHFNVLPWLPELDGISDGLEHLPEQAWSYIIRNRDGEFELPATQRRLARVQQRKAVRDHAAGTFAFSFRRIDGASQNLHVPALADARRLMDGPALRSLLHTVTGRVPLAIRQFYVSRFDEGDFLSTHCDPGQSFGVVINLTREWDPNHGGLTMLLSEDRSRVRSCLLPVRFQLLVFDTSKRLIPHFVSTVGAHGACKRLALVVRYDAAFVDGHPPD
jgi:Rps23 Pro-64 3,4-dihydroxylase Tpa1-like proline 4-hydroxylase